MGFGPVQSAMDITDNNPRLYKRHTSKIHELLNDMQDELVEKIAKTVYDYLVEKEVEVETVRPLEKSESYLVKVGISVGLRGGSIYQFTIKNKQKFDELFKDIT